MTLAVALTPNVKGIVLCDMAEEADPPEWNVIDLEKVRQQAGGPRFDPVHVFLQLEYPRGGRFRGDVRLLLDDEEVGTRPFAVEFEPGGPYVGLWAGELSEFHRAGRYLVQVWFRYDPGQCAVLKGERPFDLLEEG
ncbi:MAG: hypothetical protein ACRC33_24770 [Gemmataceae bacterium]